MVKRYEVKIRTVSDAHVYVNADSKEEAEDMAKRMCGIPYMRTSTSYQVQYVDNLNMWEDYFENGLNCVSLVGDMYRHWGWRIEQSSLKIGCAASYAVYKKYFRNYMKRRGYKLSEEFVKRAAFMIYKDQIKYYKR